MTGWHRETVLIGLWIVQGFGVKRGRNGDGLEKVQLGTGVGKVMRSGTASTLFDLE